METSNTIQHKYKITLISLSKSVDMEIASSDGDMLNELMGEFFMLFAKNVDVENKKISINQLQQNTNELKENFKTFVDAYKDKEPKLNQLNSYFKALEENEHFYLIVNNDVDTHKHIEISNMLTAIKHGESYETIKNQMDELFKEFWLNYDLKVFDKNTKQTIGEKDKAKRICRFCGKKAPEVTFKSVAHAVSEALGNKGIILNEECDDCNNKFGSKIEIDLIEYLRFYCVFFGIKGKEKIPEIKSPENLPIKEDGKNFGIKNDGEIKIEYFQTNDTEKTGDDIPINLSLRSDKDITAQNVYKTLCKYALSVIDSEHIPAYKETIKWINGEITIDKLPKVAMLVTNSFFDKHPRLTLYIRKNDNHELPFLVAELNFIALTFSFIVPLSSNDTKDFLDKTDYDNFWKTFKHYSKIKGWRYLDLSDNEKKKLTIKLNIEQRKP